MYHLYEIELESDEMWLKLQAPAVSDEDAFALFMYRFAGSVPLPEAPSLRPIPDSFDVPCRLAECCDRIANWHSVVVDLPEGWQDWEFRLAKGPYLWCSGLTEDCECHGTVGAIEAVCSDWGLPEEQEHRARRTANVKHAHYIEWLRDTVASRDRESSARSRSASRIKSEMPSQHGIYCEVHEKFHPYSGGVQAQVRAEVKSLREELATIDTSRVAAFDSQAPLAIVEMSRMLQARECATELIAGRIDLPRVLYKYLPRERIHDRGRLYARSAQRSCWH